MNEHEMQARLLQLGNGAHALALQLLGNTEDATDVVQDAIVKTLGRRGYDPAAGPLAPWFLRVVRNGCIDLLRRRRPDGVEVEALRDPAPGPQAVAEAGQRDEALHAALARIKSGQREIIVLRDYMDLSYAEIAAVLDVPAGTVMSKLHRARMALRKELIDDE